jgi:hypothetical protein
LPLFALEQAELTELPLLASPRAELFELALEPAEFPLPSEVKQIASVQIEPRSATAEQQRL